MARSRRSSSSRLVLLGFSLVAGAFGQADNRANLTVCRLLSQPAQYSGQHVKMRAEVTDPRRVQLGDPADPKCGRIPWMYPTNPDVRPKAKFSLVRDARFKELLDSFGLMIPPPPGSARETSRVIAVLEGRFDSVYRLKDGRSVRSARGIGYLGGDEHVFVLHRVLKTEILPATPAHEAQHAVDPAKPELP